MIEEVKKILDEALQRCQDSFGSDWSPQDVEELIIKVKATLNQPYEPKQNPGTKGYHDVMEFYQDEPKPDEGGMLTDEEIKAIFLMHYTRQYGEEAAKELLERLPDCNYAKAIAKAQRDLTAFIKEAEFYKIYTEAEERWETECQERIVQTVKDDADRCAQYLKAERADCQKRIERILDEIAEDFVAVVGNLYMTDKNMTLAFELWGQVKKQALKKGVK